MNKHGYMVFVETLQKFYDVHINEHEGLPACAYFHIYTIKLYNNKLKGPEICRCCERMDFHAVVLFLINLI